MRVPFCAPRLPPTLGGSVANVDVDAGAVGCDIRPAGGLSIPTVGQLIRRALPTSAVAVISFPALAWFLPDAAPELLWFLATLAVFGLLMLVHYFAQAPRPRFNKKVSRVRWQGALSSAPKFRIVPSDPDVRTAAGLAACAIVEGLVVMVAVLLGMFLGELVRPEFPWVLASCGALGVAIGSAFRIRRAWCYLNVLHAGSRSA